MPVPEHGRAAQPHPRARLEAVFDFLDDFIADQPFRGCALVNTAVEILAPTNPSRIIASDNKKQNRARLETLAREAGLRDARQLAASLSLLFEGAILTAYVESDDNAGRDARIAAAALIEAHTPA